MRPTTLLIGGIVLTLAAPVEMDKTLPAAQDPPDRASAAARPAVGSDDGGEAERAEPPRRNEIALVLAATREHDENRTFFTAGAEYERRLTRLVAIGGEFEYLDDADEWVFVFPVTFHPAGGLKVYGGPGFEDRSLSGEEAAAGERENPFLFRVGAAYGFEFADRFALSPTVSFDFIRDTDEWTRATVYGVTFGVAF